jgi:hypothetical protein
MSVQGQHCPFLNRADPRCAANFSLERLDHAFEYCFDRYQACPVYLELLVERRVRLASELAGAEMAPHAISDHAKPLVQVSISTRLRELARRIVGSAGSGAGSPKSRSDDLRR